MKKGMTSLELGDRELETIPAKVCRILREAILRGDFEPGERLVQDELAKSIGVSRMPIREAIRRLETEGLVTIEAHRGAVVKAFGLKEIEEIYHLRVLFEKEAVKASVENMQDNKIKELEGLMQEMEGTDNIDHFVQINIEFHRVLMSDCPWERLNAFIFSLWSGFPQQTPHMLPDQIKRSNAEHREIMQAVKKKDGQLAGELTAEHIQRAGTAIVKSISEKNNGSTS